MKKIISATLITLILGLCGCVYHPPVYQGNVLTPEKMQSIKVGMTSAQVTNILGSPVLKNVYTQNHIAYIYTSQPSNKKMVVKKLEVDLRNDRVTNVRTWL